MELELSRTYFPNGTNGEFFFNGNRVCSSIELPWKNNQHRISCIPEGRYELRKRYTAERGRHLILADVPGRQLILIHAANDAKKELQGCIAPVCILIAEGKGSQSRIAVAKINTIVFPVLDKKKQFFLIIKS